MEDPVVAVGELSRAKHASAGTLASSITLAGRERPAATQNEAHSSLTEYEVAKVPEYILIGLIDAPERGEQADFDQWFIDQHIEDTTMCPGFIRGRVAKLSGPHLEIDTPSQYMSIYEVEADSYEEAERVLNEWQANPDAWEGRAKHRETRERIGELPITILGSGWYETVGSHGSSGADL